MEGATGNGKTEGNASVQEEGKIEGIQAATDYYSKVGDVGDRIRQQSRIRLEGISTEDIEEIRKIFNVFDNDENGQITANELRHIIRSLGQSTTEAEAMDIMNSIDADGNGVIEFPEFLALISGKYQKMKRNYQMEEVFQIFDTDGTGEINAGNLKRMFSIFGQNFTEKEIQQMLHDADSDKDGKVKYDDFVKMMSE